MEPKGHFSRGFSLFKKALLELYANPSIILLGSVPWVFSGVVSLGVVYHFRVNSLQDFHDLWRSINVISDSYIYYVIPNVIYTLTSSFLQIFCNVAIAIFTLYKLRDRKVSIFLSLNKGYYLFGPVFAWSCIDAIIRLSIGQIWIVLILWGILTLFVPPLIVDEKSSPYKLFLRSSHLSFGLIKEVIGGFIGSLFYLFIGIFLYYIILFLIPITIPKLLRLIIPVLAAIISYMGFIVFSILLYQSFLDRS